MMYINSITGLFNQDLKNHNPHVGQWVKRGKSGKVDFKGVYMGDIDNQPIYVEDFGEPRPFFRQRMKETRSIVKLANGLINKSELM